MQLERCAFIFSCPRLYCPNPISILALDCLATTYTAGSVSLHPLVAKEPRPQDNRGSDS